MATKIIRITDDLDSRGKAYAKALGISFNALAVLALSEYLESKTLLSEDFKLEPPPLTVMHGGKDEGESLQARRAAERMAKKAKRQ